VYALLIGILETDKLDDEIQQGYGSYAEMFCRLFISVDNTVTFKNYQVISNEFPADINECDAYLITGSKSSAYDTTDWIVKLKQFINTLNKHKKTLIGICFGHQIIAEALGGKVQQSDKGWGLGTMTYSVLKKQSWMQNSVNQFKLVITHHDQVQVLPPTAQLIAGNDFCPIAAFQLEHHILTFQGHPEFTADFANHLLKFQQPPLTVETLRIVQSRLNETTDHCLVAQWILNFIINNLGKV
jgi:GMP synthase-like glutamine amidotransferase